MLNKEPTKKEIVRLKGLLIILIIIFISGLIFLLTSVIDLSFA